MRIAGHQVHEALGMEKKPKPGALWTGLTMGTILVSWFLAGFGVGHFLEMVTSGAGATFIGLGMGQPIAYQGYQWGQRWTRARYGQGGGGRDALVGGEDGES